jgi:hypothetical protein
VEGAWDELAKHNRSNNPIWVSDIRSRFGKEVFDPATQIVCKFINTLYRYASKISETNRLIKDFEIRKRLLSALPKGISSELWQ